MIGIFTKFSDPWDAKIEEKYMPKKNNHTQDNIYMVWQFTYIHGVVGISLFSEKKNTKCSSTVFSQKQHQNPNL